MAGGRRVTQADLARRAGVSRSCVSRVVRGLDKVSDDKRERVLRAARELGYIDNGMATALAGNRRRNLVGFLPQSISNQVFGQVYDALKAGMSGDGPQFVIVEGSYDREEEDRQLRELVSFGPDCIVVAGYAGSTDALTAAAHSIPIVSVTRRIWETGVVSVFNDDRAGALLATEHLLSLGHRRIAHLQLPPDTPYEQRAAGYVTAMERAGLTPWLVTPDSYRQSDAYRAVRSLYESGAERPTAIFCGSDHLALGVLDALHEVGVRVPQDVSVMGYDNQPVARLTGLSTVDQRAGYQGQVAAEFVRGFLAEDNQGEGTVPPGGAETHRVVDPHLELRATTASVRV